MFWLKRLCILSMLCVSAMAFSGCGGSSSVLAVMPDTPAPPPDGRTTFKSILNDLNKTPAKKVTWVGDSITEQGKPDQGSGVGRGVGFTTFIERAYPSISYSNQGVGGSTTLGVIGRLPAIIATGADLYVVAIGVCDARYNDSRGATTQDEYINNMKTIVTSLQSTGAKVVVLSIWPTYAKDHYAALGPQATNERYKQWNHALEQASTAWGVPYIDAYSKIVSVITPENVDALVPDGVHPDYAGVAAKQIYADAVMY